MPAGKVCETVVTYYCILLASYYERNVGFFKIYIYSKEKNRKKCLPVYKAFMCKHGRILKYRAERQSTGCSKRPWGRVCFLSVQGNQTVQGDQWKMSRNTLAFVTGNHNKLKEVSTSTKRSRSPNSFQSIS